MIHRTLLQDSRVLPHRILLSVPRPFHVLRVSVQHINEDHLHLSHSPDHLLDQVQIPFLQRESIDAQTYDKKVDDSRHY